VIWSTAAAYTKTHLRFLTHNILPYEYSTLIRDNHVRIAEETHQFLKTKDDCWTASDDTRFLDLHARFYLVPFHHALWSLWLHFAILLGATRTLSNLHRRWNVSFQSLVKKERGYKCSFVITTYGSERCRFGVLWPCDVRVRHHGNVRVLWS
jgi:hypothetical protein